MPKKSKEQKSKVEQLLNEKTVEEIEKTTPQEKMEVESCVKVASFGPSYYDNSYYITPEGKKYTAYDGTIKGWSYANPTGEFLGAGPITEAWKTVFECKNMLDVGAGRGTFIAHARNAGIEAVGFDYSDWAVSDEGRYPNCKADWLIKHDALQTWPYDDNEFDLVVCLDLLEHIYESNIPLVISEIYRVSKKWIFLQIATSKNQGYILKEGESIPLELEGCAVAGHVTVKPEFWWLNKFYRNYSIPRRSMAERFISLVDPAIIANWLRNSIIIIEKISQKI